MTQEEAIKVLENGGWWDLFIPVTTIEGRIEEDKLYEALDLAVSALRPITREQVEKMRGNFFQAGIDDVAQDTWRCSWCLVQEFGDIRGINFCPSCGTPMTDEAVALLAKRLEEVLKDGSCD